MKFVFYNLILGCMLLYSSILSGQVEDRQPFPFVITNNTEFPDEDVYVAILGEDFSGGAPGQPHRHIWVDMKTGQQNLMNKAYNTVPGPVYVMVYDDPNDCMSYNVIPARNDQEGNRNPDQTALYADIFTKLSEIPDRTVMLQPIQGSRVYISLGEQLYLFFHGPGPGDPKGYTAPAPTDPTDPNQGILHEVIELTYDKWGYFANTTRVDSYKFPIAMDVWGLVHDEEVHKQVGERQSHEYIINAWKDHVKDYPEFVNCLNEHGEITQPTKTRDFADGTIGSMCEEGVHVNYMQPYIDQIWNKYRNEDLHFYTGDAGYFKGRVVGDVLTVTSQSVEGGPFYGRSGVVNGKPTTQEVLEGKGLMDNVVNDRTVDLMIQAQLTAAITRHVVDVNTPNVGVQYWNDPSQYYLEQPANMYAAFWHREDISVDGRSYGFAYDDVWDQSSSAPVHHPHRVEITMGGFYGIEEAVFCNAGGNITLQYPAENSILLDGSESYSTVGNDLTYQWTQVSGGSGVNLSNANEAIASASFSELGEFVFSLNVSDGTNESNCQVTVLVRDENASAPYVNAGPDQSISVPASSITLYGEATDLDGDIVAYQWTQVQGPSQASLIGQSSATLTASNLVIGSYTFRLTATDDDGLTGYDEAFVHVMGDGDCIGEAHNGDYSYIFSGDQSNPTITFVPSRAGVGSNIVIINVGGAGYTITANKTYTVTANAGANISFFFTYNVPEGGERNTQANPHSETVGNCGSSNLYPLVDAGTDITIDLKYDSNIVTLNGTGSDPEDGSNVTFLWSQLSGPDMAILSNANTATLQAAGLIEGVYKFQLAVSDTDQATSTDVVYVFVNYTGGSTPINDKEVTRSKIEVYPNPVNNTLIVNLGNVEGYRVAELYNINGSLVLGQAITSNELKINVSALPRSIYIVMIKGEDSVKTFRVVKN